MTARLGFSLTGRGPLAERASLARLAKRAEALGYDSRSA